MKKFTIKVYDNETGELVTDPEAAITETGGYFLLAQHGAGDEVSGVAAKCMMDNRMSDGNRNAFVRACFQSVITRLEKSENDFAEVQACTIHEFMQHLETKLGAKEAARMCLHMAEQLAKKAIEAAVEAGEEAGETP